MKLTKKLEVEIKEVMKDYWASYFKGDLETWSHFLPDDYVNIGSTEEEIWNSKKEMLAYSEAVVPRMVGSVEIRNKSVQIIPLAPYFMVHEFLDMFVKAGAEWAFYSKFRLSSIVQKTGDGWKVIHQHGSVPDSKAQEGESIGFQKISKENLELREAVKRRTVELEYKNRELEIEASMERVRSRAMSMQHSSELAETSFLMAKQVRSLGIQAWGCAFNIFDDNQDSSTEWFSNEHGYLPTYKTPREGIFLRYYEAAQRGETLHVEEIIGEACTAHYHYLCTLPVVGDALIKLKESGVSFPASQIDHVAYFKHGYLLFITFEPVPEAYDIFKRFAKVFEQTYTRFLDLQKAEAQAKEAQIEASLERVRSKAMAMHSSEDLAATIAKFYHELELFSITPRRCGVGLLNKESRIAELSTMNTNEEGRSIEIIGKIKMEGHPVLEGVYEHWLTGTEYHPVLRGNEIKDYYQLLRPQISFPDYPHDTVQYGYFFFFPEGGVYAWTNKEMEEDELRIYRRFTSVLSLTYKRYKDLQQAEELARQAEEDLVNLKIEKKKTEEALTGLRAAQFQLIQAEKMASLGELTAGIAHEIQNPLNFVNNFSEVSNELIDEMNAEIKKGAVEEAIALANDIRQNLEKITHHGKRADAIVKGMLQHSRSSSNATKELTDINALADEYLRLAYQGLRAKDSSFKANIKTEYDEAIDHIDIVPQDIGRVILNLINNAFYSVTEKSKKLGYIYEPMVSISTRQIVLPPGGPRAAEIRVRDNGNGISQKILDKIFQPFFTTKPTGQGTGLGLSLSYDIIKAHGGELQVQTKEGDYAQFIVTIPVNPK